MVAESELVCRPNVAVNFLCAPSPASPALGIPSPPVSVPIGLDLSRRDPALSCSPRIQNPAPFETPTKKPAPNIRSGSHTDIGPRSSNEDQHVCIDNLGAHLGSSHHSFSEPSSFYAVFDGHGGPDAALYMKDNITRFFFEDSSELPQTPSDIDEKQLLQDHRRWFLAADKALADEISAIDSYSGTTALTALILGRNLFIANVGDSRAVLCRGGNPVQLSQDHRPTCEIERKRVEALGGKIEYGYLNGELAVTRALGDWYMKSPFESESESPLTAEPELEMALLTKDDEFLIIGCDGIWDVMSNQEAVGLVRRELMCHGDPQKCAEELTNQALMRDSGDNVTAIVICFWSRESWDFVPVPRRPRFKFSVSEEARSTLRSLLEGN